MLGRPEPRHGRRGWAIAAVAACLGRRALRKDPSGPGTKNLPRLCGGEDSLESLPVCYGLGDELVVVVVDEELLLPDGDEVFTVVLDEFEDEPDVPPEGDDLSMTVVLLSLFFSAGGLVTVVSFCSHAARKAMLIKRQMYFMISRNRNKRANCVSVRVREWLMESYLCWYRSPPGWRS
jgi:hypothetical protein